MEKFYLKSFRLKSYFKKKVFFFDKFFFLYFLDNSLNFFVKLYFLIKNKLFFINMQFYLFFINNFFLFKNKLYIYNYYYRSLKNYKMIFNFFNKNIRNSISLDKSIWFKKVYLHGLGFRLFLYKNNLIFRLGYSHFIKVNLPSNIQVFYRQRSQIIFYSYNKAILGNFIFKCFNLKLFDFYKGKGISFYQKKSNIKLKVRKQQ